jgi:hypothetical protein
LWFAIGCGGDKKSGPVDMSMSMDTDGMMNTNDDLSGTDLAGVDLAGLAAPGCSTACSVGAKSCDGNGVRTCQDKGNNCSAWSDPVPCGGGGVCSGGECVGTCSNQCDPGDTFCSQNGFRTCATTLTGCTDWSATVTACNNGAVCSGGVCTDKCVDRCSAGQTICAGFGVQKCERKFSGCLDWSDPFPCDSGKVCSAGQCVLSCTDQCTAGNSQCEGSDSIAICEKQASGCTDLSLPQLCGSGVCSSNACQTCMDMTKRCSAQGNVEECTMGAFSEIASCAFGCSMGACTTMVTCNPGAVQCNGNQVVVCNSTGSAFLFETTCPNGCSNGLCLGTCTENSLRCNGNDLEKCTSGAFVKQMTCSTSCQQGQCVLPSLDVATTQDLNGLVIVQGAVTVDGTGNLTSTMGNLTIQADTIHISGTITISPTGTTALGQPGDGTLDGNCGGTGGSYGTNGLTGCVGARSAWGSQFDSDVQPGSPGGAGGTTNSTGGAGGKGGGVVRLIANSITIDAGGKILADGANGTGVTTSQMGGGGGGSGGGILLAADQINVAGILSVAGGPGGTSTSGAAGNQGGVGRIKILHGSSVTVDTTGSKLTSGAFDGNVGTVNDKDLIPPLTITSSTHPDQTLTYNDGAPNLGLTWTHPFASAMGFYQILNTTQPSSLSTSNLPQPSNAGNLVRADLISLDPGNLMPGSNFFQIISVSSTAVFASVESHYQINVNVTPPTVSSSSHPSQTMFVNTHDVFWSWTLPGADTNYTGVYYVVDQFGDTIPTTAGTFVPISTKQIIKNLPTNGVYAIHIVSADTMGYLTKAAKHYAVRIGDPTTMLVGSITGTVFDNKSNAVTGATITVNHGLLNLGASGTPTPIMTDSMGKFGVSMLPPGTWEVEASAPGFKTGTAMATVVDATAQVVTITLQPSP